MNSNDQVFIGIDGGGTKTAGAAVLSDGTVLALHTGEGINQNNIGMDQARENLWKVVFSLEKKCGKKHDFLYLGSPALDKTADEATVMEIAGDLLDPQRIAAESDVYMALMGMTLGEPGMIVVCGTGSMAVLDDGVHGQKAAGGWGSILGDPGSGYSIAIAGLQAAIDAWEKTGPDTILAECAINHFHLSTPRQLIDRIYAPDSGPHIIAKFAESVLRSAEAGDTAARKILFEEMNKISAQAASLLRGAAQVNCVGLYGGIFQHSDYARNVFISRLEANVKDRPLRWLETSIPPELGAVIFGFKQRGMLTQAVLQRLKETYDACCNG